MNAVENNESAAMVRENAPMLLASDPFHLFHVSRRFIYPDLPEWSKLMLCSCRFSVVQNRTFNQWLQCGLSPADLHESNVCGNCLRELAKRKIELGFPVFEDPHSHYCFGCEVESECLEGSYCKRLGKGMCETCTCYGDHALWGKAIAAFRRWVAHPINYRRMPSKYSGICQECGERFDVGDEIAWLPQGGASHGACVPVVQL